MCESCFEEEDYTVYKQCFLAKNNYRQISWIPKNLAKLNNIIKFKENNEWNDGWKVLEVYSFERKRPYNIRFPRKKRR